MRRLTCGLAAATIALAPAAAAAKAPAPGAKAHRATRAAPKRPARPPGALPFAPFVLQTVRIEGSTEPETVAAAARPFIGRTIDAASLKQLADAVSRAYERSGRIALYTVAVPEQDFAGGALRLQVLEGWAETVQIRGAEGRDLSLVKAYARRITAERPLTKATLQRYVSLIKDIPGLKPDVQLLAGARPGAVQVVVDVHPKPVQVALGINNRGTALLGRTQVQADLYLNSLLRQGDQTRLSVALPTDVELFQLYSAAHSQPIGGDGAMATVFGSYLKTRPKGAFLAGHARGLGVQLSYPLRRSYERNVYVTLGFDGLNSDNALFGTRFSADHSRAARLGLIVSDRTARREASLAATASVGAPILGARTLVPGITDLSFSKLNLRAGYLQALGKAWVLRLGGAVQFTGDRLPGSEQMSLGGEEFGRAYEAAFVSGDRGYAASVELAYRPAFVGAVAKGAEIYAFADDGKVWYLGRLGFPTQSYEVASAGGGVRVPVKSRLLLQVEAARGLANPLAGLDRERWRAVFAVKSVF